MYISTHALTAATHVYINASTNSGDSRISTQGLRSPRVGESGEPNRVVAEAAAEQSPYALRKRPWDI